MDDKAKEIIGMWDRGNSDRGTTISHWQDCANYMQPNRNDYLAEKSPGQKRMQYVYDSAPIWCREQFAAGCHSQITSTTLMWFSLRVDDSSLDKQQDVRQWLELASAAMYAVFNSPRYNFASQSAEIYDDLGTIGTACMGMVEGKDGMPLFSTRHMKECVFFENEEDRVDTLVRRWTWTARQAVSKWGDKAGEKVVKAFQEKPDTKFPFMHSVQPRAKRNSARSDAKHMPFESVYVSADDATTISEGGFPEFPYLTPRYAKITGEIYGRGPGMTALPDVKMLNEAKKLVIKAAQKVIDPPLDVPDDTYLLGVKTVPGSINFRPRNLRPDDGIRPIMTQGNIGIGTELLEGLRNEIARVFFVDILRMPTDIEDPSSDGKGSTATYWMQRREKEFMAMSPFLARTRSELCGPLIDRTFAMMWRKSMLMKFGPGSPFPPPPAQLRGAKLRVDYVSPIELAQRSSQGDAIDKILARQQQLRTIDPNSPIIADFEAIMRLTAQEANAPASALKSPEQLQQEAEQQAQAEQAMQNHMAVANLAKSAKDGSAAVKNMADAGGGNDNQGQEAA